MRGESITHSIFTAQIRHRRFEYGDNSTALFHFGVLLDPLSEAAQKWTSLLQVCETCSSVTCWMLMCRHEVAIERSGCICRIICQPSEVYRGELPEKNYFARLMCSSTAPVEEILPL